MKTLIKRLLAFLLVLFAAAVLLALLVKGGRMLYHWALEDELRLSVMKDVPEPRLRPKSDSDCQAHCVAACEEVRNAKWGKTMERLVPLASTNSVGATPVAEEPKPSVPQKKNVTPPANKKPQKKPAEPAKKYEQKMLAAPSAVKPDAGEWQTNELPKAASEPPQEGKKTCVRHFMALLPSVNPMRIEDYCACASKNLGQPMDFLATAEEFNTAWRSQASACYGTRLTKKGEAEDAQFLHACEQDRGAMFPEFAKTYERRKSGFCDCYGSGLSALGYNPSNADIPRDVTKKMYGTCFVSYPPEM